MRREFKTRATILEPGRHSESPQLVIEGRVRIERTYGLKRPQFVADVGPGDFVGETGSFSGVARSATAIALEPVETLDRDGAA
ncbi:MAG: cyclic nucleotide-binding domain-containing protein [Chloroflexi bacterium]|nr:cyclic nucleotide-binding domain-containing protein [Chloroflexota bacterium]